jgi:hypothetical protein
LEKVEKLSFVDSESDSYDDSDSGEDIAKISSRRFRKNDTERDSSRKDYFMLKHPDC